MEELQNLDFDSLGSTKARFTVIYDGFCSVCNASVRFLRKVDSLGSFSYLRLQDIPKLSGNRIPVSLLQESMHVVDGKTGNVWKGMDGIWRLLLHAPPAFPLFLLVTILKGIGISDAVYAWISASRFRLSRILAS